MSVITTSAHPKALWPGVNAWFGVKYKEKPMQWSGVFTEETSDKGYEEDVESTGFGIAGVKPEGDAVRYDTHQQGGTSKYIHSTYALGYIVTAEEISDNKYPVLATKRAGALAFSMRQSKEIVHANIFNRAFTSGYNGYDGKELLATDHPTIYGDQSNELATPADLSEAALEDLLIQIRNAVNSRGLKISLMGEMLIVPPALEYEAERILNSSLRPGTANNDLNAIRSRGKLPQGAMVYDYLTDADNWFIKTDCPDGLKSMKRWALKFSKDNDFDTENAKAKAMERYSAGWSDWRCLFGSAPS